MHPAGCRCFFLSLPHSLPTCWRKHVFACTRNSSAAHTQELDDGLIYHARLTLARGPDGWVVLCLSKLRRSTEGFQFSPRCSFRCRGPSRIYRCNECSQRVRGSDNGAEVLARPAAPPRSATAAHPGRSSQNTAGTNASMSELVSSDASPLKEFQRLRRCNDGYRENVPSAGHGKREC